MFDKRIVFMLFIGLVALIGINSIYSFKGLQPKSKLSCGDVVDRSLFIGDNTIVLTEENRNTQLSNVEVIFYQEINGKHLEIEEILEKDDITQNLFSTSILRMTNEGADFNKMDFQKIHQLSDVSTYKNRHNPRNEGLLKNLEFFVYYKDEKVEKIKIQSLHPFEIENKRVEEYKSYQIENNQTIIQNTEVKYSVGKKHYKVLVKTEYAI